MTRTGPLFSLIIAAAWPAGAALAQPQAVTVPQVSAPERPAAAAETTDVSSLGAASASSSRSSRSALTSSPEQVGDQKRTVEGAPSLSTPAQGRAVGVTAVGGRDRCDPANGASRSEACRHRLETRSGEYDNAAAAPVTAEGRLLLLTQPQTPAANVDSATRRLGGPSSQLDALTGGASNQLAAAISSTAATDAAAANAAASSGVTVLTPGAPSGAAPVVVSPTR